MKTVLLSIILACETRILALNITTSSISGDVLRPTKIYHINRKFDAYVPPPSTPVNLFQDKDSVHVKTLAHVNARARARARNIKHMTCYEGVHVQTHVRCKQSLSRPRPRVHVNKHLKHSVPPTREQNERELAWRVGGTECVKQWRIQNFFPCEQESHGDIWKWDYWCQQQPLKGNCLKSLDKFYYNTQLAKCVKFKYSGCGGNNNRFDSIENCQRHCQGQALMGFKKSERTSETCLLQPSPGLCMSILHRFYYDANINDCKSFIYGGCGGNGNRFHTKHNCRKMCRK